METVIDFSVKVAHDIPLCRQFGTQFFKHYKRPTWLWHRAPSDRAHHPPPNLLYQVPSPPATLLLPAVSHGHRASRFGEHVVVVVAAHYACGHILCGWRWT